MQKVVFKARIKVDRHAIKKNSKQIFVNRFTGKRFITSSEKAKSLEQLLVNQLIKEKLKQRIDPISTFCKISFNFIHPKSVWFTKKNTFSHKIADLSNLFESPCDALQKSGILENDRLIESFDGSKRSYQDFDNHYYLDIEISIET